MNTCLTHEMGSVKLALIVLATLSLVKHNVAGVEETCFDSWPYCNIYTPPCTNESNPPDNMDILQVCQRTCAICLYVAPSIGENGICKDREDCSHYVTYTCDRNNSWFRENCPVSCNMCPTDTTPMPEESSQYIGIPSVNLQEVNENGIYLFFHSCAVDGKETREVIENNTLSEICSADCLPNCTLNWQKSVGGKYTTVSQNENLYIPSIQRDQRGTYRCVDADNKDVIYRVIEIVVTYVPSIITKMVSGKETDLNELNELSENDVIKLSCTLDSSPAPEVTWSRTQGLGASFALESDFTIRPSHAWNNDTHHNLYTSEVIIHKARCEDTDTYMCMASNKVGVAYPGRINIGVMCAPSNTQGEDRLKDNYTTPEGGHLSITFQIRGYPVSRISSIMHSNQHDVKNRLFERDHWTQIITENTAEPLLTTITLKMENLTSEFFDNYFYLNITNRKDTTMLKFLLIAEDTKGSGAAFGFQGIVALISVLPVIAFIFIIVAIILKIERQKYFRLRASNQHDPIVYRDPGSPPVRQVNVMSDPLLHVYSELSDGGRHSSFVAFRERFKSRSVTDRYPVCQICGYSHSVKDSCQFSVRTSTKSDYLIPHCERPRVSGAESFHTARAFELLQVCHICGHCHDNNGPCKRSARRSAAVHYLPLLSSEDAQPEDQ